MLCIIAWSIKSPPKIVPGFNGIGCLELRSARLTGTSLGPNDQRHLGRLDACQSVACATSSTLAPIIKLADSSILFHIALNVILMNALVEIIVLVNQWQALYLLYRLKIQYVGRPPSDRVEHCYSEE